MVGTTGHRGKMTDFTKLYWELYHYKQKKIAKKISAKKQELIDKLKLQTAKRKMEGR